MSLYDILQIKPNATIQEIKNSYKNLARKYHPDKNLDKNANEKFRKINNAYEILSDDSSRKKYNKMNNLDKSNFEKFLNKIFMNKLKVDELENLGIKLSKKDFNYLEGNLVNLLNKLNLYDLIKLFTTNEIPTFDSQHQDILCSDSEVELWDRDQSEYYYNLPIIYKKYNKNDLRVELDISISDINEKRYRKIKLNRKINDVDTVTTFIFNIEKPYVVFLGGGDIDENVGNLIISLKLPNCFEWKNNTIIFNYPMNLYDMIYGMDLNIDLGIKKINIISWTPSRDGYEINFDDINISNHKLLLKFFLNYNHNEDKEKILKLYFND